MKTIATTLNDDETKRLEDLCKRKGITKFILLKRLVLNYMESEKMNEVNERVIDLSRLRDDLWEEFSKKSKRLNKPKEHIIAEMILRWTRGKFKLSGEE